MNQATILEKEIRKKLKGPTRKAKIHGRYVGAVGHEARKANEQSKLEFWGHDLPTQRSIAKSNFAALKNLSVHEQWPIWLNVWKQSSIYDVKSIALIWLSNPKFKELRQIKAKDIFSYKFEDFELQNYESYPSIKMPVAV